MNNAIDAIGQKKTDRLNLATLHTSPFDPTAIILSVIYVVIPKAIRDKQKMMQRYAETNHHKPDPNEAKDFRISLCSYCG